MPIREVRAGLVETIKHACLYDKDFFEYLEKNIDKIVNADNKVLDKEVCEYITQKNCQIKYDVVIQDEKEENLVEKEEDIFELTFSKEENEIEEEEESDLEIENELITAQEKVAVKTAPFFDRLKGNNTKKPKQQKQPKPVPEASVDNWFFKNFGLGKLFEDDVEDDAM